MTLEELRHLCAASSREEWELIHCWGAGSGPSYLGHPYQHVRESEDEPLVIETHSMRATYRPDISIGLAWGIASNSDFKEDWANDFPDPHAHSSIVDFLFNGSLVDREYYVVVDGGRADLPIPRRRDDGRLTVTQWQYDFFSVLDGLEKLSEFGRYVRQAGFEIE